MPAIGTEDNLTTSTPHRINLPPLKYLTPAIREAAERYLTLHHEAWEHRQVTLNRAELAVHNAERGDEQAMADALLGGADKLPKARSATTRAETRLADARAKQSAYWQALGRSYAALRQAVLDHADEWRATVAAEHADARQRYRQAAAELETAARDLVATGSVLAMLDRDPGGLVLRPYRAAAVQLSRAGSAVSEALAALDAEERVAPSGEPDEPIDVAV